MQNPRRPGYPADRLTPLRPDGSRQASARASSEVPPIEVTTDTPRMPSDGHRGARTSLQIRSTGERISFRGGRTAQPRRTGALFPRGHSSCDRAARRPAPAHASFGAPSAAVVRKPRSRSNGRRARRRPSRSSRWTPRLSSRSCNRRPTVEICVGCQRSGKADVMRGDEMCLRAGRDTAWLVIRHGFL